MSNRRTASVTVEFGASPRLEITEGAVCARFGMSRGAMVAKEPDVPI